MSTTARSVCWRSACVGVILPRLCLERERVDNDGSVWGECSRRPRARRQRGGLSERRMPTALSDLFFRAGAKSPPDPVRLFPVDVCLRAHVCRALWPAQAGKRTHRALRPGGRWQPPRRRGPPPRARRGRQPHAHANANEEEEEEAIERKEEQERVPPMQRHHIFSCGGDPLQSAPCLLLQINQQGQGVMPPIVVVVAQDGSWRAAASASMPERCCRSTSQERQLSSTHTRARALCGSRAPILPRASSSTRRLEVRLSDRLPVRLHLRQIRSRAGHRRGRKRQKD
jgi:hypothetical protein